MREQVRRSKKTGRSDKEPRHVRLYHTFLKTEAWKSLSVYSRAIYVEISARYGGPGSNNGRIPYAVRDAAKSLKIGKTTAATALEQLQDRGFIVEVTKGGFNVKTKLATEWRLTEFSCDITDALPTRDYAQWSPQNSFHGTCSGTNGSCSGTVRYPQRDSEPVEWVKNPSDGTCSGTVEGPHGTCSGTRIVCQSVAPEAGTEREVGEANEPLTVMAFDALRHGDDAEPVKVECLWSTPILTEVFGEDRDAILTEYGMSKIRVLRSPLARRLLNGASIPAPVRVA
jgi:hypothetical protein